MTGGRGLLLVAAIPAILVVMLLAADAAHAAPPTYATTCPTAPAPTTGITDDAIETRNQRIADIAICEAIAERLEYANLWPEGDRERLDLGWYGSWAVAGILLGVMAGAMLNSAFKFWDGDDG